MKRSMTLTLIVALTIIALTPGIGEKTRAEGMSAQPQQRIKVNVADSPRIPAAIENADATSVQDQTVLRYKLANRAGRQLTTIEVVAFVVDKSGSVKGGEGWTLRESSPSDHTEGFVRILKSRVENGNHLVLAIWRAGDGSGMFELDKTELDNILRPRASATRRHESVPLVRAAFRRGEYCADRLAIAEAKCACGVKTFGCNPTSGEWSFGCYTKAESPGCRPPVLE